MALVKSETQTSAQMRSQCLVSCPLIRSIMVRQDKRVCIANKEIGWYTKYKDCQPGGVTANNRHKVLTYYIH